MGNWERLNAIEPKEVPTPAEEAAEIVLPLLKGKLSNAAQEPFARRVGEALSRGGWVQLTDKEAHALLIDFHGSLEDPDPRAWDGYEDWKIHQESARNVLRSKLAPLQQEDE